MSRILLVVIVLLVGALVVEAMRGARDHATGVRAALRLDSVQTAHDTTREVDIAALHDSVRVFVRRAQQQMQRADALDRALNATRLARINARVRLAALDTVVKTDTVIAAPDSTRHSRFHIREEPYTIVGDISRRSTWSGDSVAVHIDLDSIPLQLRLSCQAGSGTPVKQALAAVVAPHWAHVVLGDIEQQAEVCNPGIAPPTVRSRVATLLGRLGISAGAGVVLEPDGQIVARPTLVVGMRLWP